MESVEMIKSNDPTEGKHHAFNTEQVIKSYLIKGADGDLTESKQIKDSFEDEVEILEPPYTPLLWASLMEKNTRLSKLIRLYARNTVGLGYKITTKKPVKRDTEKSVKAQIEKEKEILEEFFDNVNPMMPVEEIFYRAKVDEESMGNGYVEIVRGLVSSEKVKVGLPTALYHVPGHTIRILRNEKGYLQIRNGKKRYFKIFNGDFDMDANTGETKPLGSIKFADRASELLHFSIYTPRDSYYGIPRYVSSADAIAGNKLASRRNLAFFKNDATPRIAITVANGQLTGQSIKDIKDFINIEGKGSENAHRAMVLQAQSKNIGDMNTKDVKIDLIPLTVGSTDDASFIKYRDSNDEEIREAFGIGEVFLGAKGSVNRSTATVSRQITNEQEFVPDAKVKEFSINQTICRAFGVKYVKFQFERPNSLDELDKAEIYSKYLQAGGITPNDARHELGKDEYTEPWGDVPIQIGLVEYQMKVLGAQGAISQTGNTNDQSNQDSQSDQNSDSNSDTSNQDSKKNNDAAFNMLVKQIEKMVNDYASPLK